MVLQTQCNLGAALHSIHHMINKAHLLIETLDSSARSQSGLDDSSWFFNQHTERCRLMQLPCICSAQQNQDCSSMAALGCQHFEAVCQGAVGLWALQGLGAERVLRAGREGQFLIFRCSNTYCDAFSSLHEVPGHLAIAHDKGMKWESEKWACWAESLIG